MQAGLTFYIKALSVLLLLNVGFMLLGAVAHAGHFLVYLVRVHTFFFHSLSAKGADDGLQVVFSLVGQLWAFLTFQYIWFLLLIT